MSVRNIRNHQSRGLLPPPEVKGRTGYYGEEHIARLRLVQELQTEGFKLDVIKRLIAERRRGPVRGAAPCDPGSVRDRVAGGPHRR